MRFTHIHCSSRFSRSVSTLEQATDSFYKRSSIVTFTEVGHTSRKKAPYENGWGYYNASGGDGFDECGIAWDLDTWQVKWRRAVKLSGRWRTNGGGTRWPIVACTVFLKHKSSGHTMLVSVTHMPNKIGGKSGFKPQGQGFKQRKSSYIKATQNWNDYIAQAMRTHKPDIVLIASDWNLNFRLKWVRQWVNNAFRKCGLHHTWKNFSNRGTFGRSVIDASLVRGVSTGGAHVINDVADSTDHTPYQETFETTHAPRTPLKPGEGAGTKPDPDTTTGGGGHGIEWWNFEDYADDTIYEVEQV